MTPERSTCGVVRKGRPPCKQVAGYGTDHLGAGPCKFHGGAFPGPSKKAHAELADRNARTWLGQNVTIQPVDNPLAAFRDLAGKALAWLEAADGLMARIREDDVRYTGRAGEQLRAEVAVYERAMATASNVLSQYARLRIDERLVAITEEQKRMVIRALEAGLASAGIAGPAATEAKQVAARHLRAVGEAA